MPDTPRPATALEDAVARVGDRWALLLVDALLAGPLRFGDLQDALPGIAPNVLTQRLRHLEKEGVVVAKPYSQRPLRMIYELTAAGHDLAGALRLLAQWGAGAHVADADAHAAGTARHPDCGTALEARWWCPTCARTVDDPDDGTGMVRL